LVEVGLIAFPSAICPATTFGHADPVLDAEDPVLHRFAEVAVDQQHALPGLRHGDREVAGGGRLAVARGGGRDEDALGLPSGAPK
jgi:hypothetical protein